MVGARAEGQDSVAAADDQIDRNRAAEVGLKLQHVAIGKIRHGVMAEPDPSTCEVVRVELEVDPVQSCAAGDQVIVRLKAGIDGVITIAPQDRIIPKITMDLVRTDAANQAVIAKPTEQVIPHVTCDQRVVSGIPIEVVHHSGGPDHIVIGGNAISIAIDAKPATEAARGRQVPAVHHVVLQGDGAFVVGARAEGQDSVAADVVQ